MEIDVELMGLQNKPTDLAFPGSHIAVLQGTTRYYKVLQDSYSVSFTVNLDYLSPMMLAFTGDPLAVLWYDMSKINPHWYLGEQDAHLV